MKRKEEFDREEAMSLLPTPDESLISAESLTLRSTPYDMLQEREFDKADNKKISALELIEARKRKLNESKESARKPPVVRDLSKYNPSSVEKAKAYAQSRMEPAAPGVTGRGSADTTAAVNELIRSIGVNLDLKFSRKDTKELISVLLTCDEAQLENLFINKQTPIMVKTIIQSILEDFKNKSMSTVERLWNRLFGSTFDEQQPASAQPGTTINVLSIVPGISDGTRPISREGYALLQKQIFGSDVQDVEAQQEG